MESALKLFETILRLATSIERARLIWEKNQDKVKQMVKEGRDPSPEEWKEIFDLVYKQSRELQD